MLRSLYLYSSYILKLLFSKNRSLVVHDLFRNSLISPGKDRSLEFGSRDRGIALEKAMYWLLSAQNNMKDKGIGSYHLTEGWSSSYPETTGYIIPTFITYGKRVHKEHFIKNALEAADWLVSIQKPSGGWQGGRVNENKPEIVFNTGQVMRGMISAYKHIGDEKYRAACIRAGDWLCEIQHPEGFWKKHALMDRERVYDSYVDVPLIDLSRITGDENYSKHAIKNLNWIISSRQRENGWFEDCDNTVKHNDRPILHTIAYTVDGLIDSGRLLNEEIYIRSAKKAADALLDIFTGENYLHGRYDNNWKGTEHMILTGCAQMSVVWLKLFEIFNDERYLEASSRMNEMLIFIQNREVKESHLTEGAVPGSFPLWGKYEPFAFPNWATKFFADALMLESEIKEKNARKG